MIGRIVCTVPPNPRKLSADEQALAMMLARKAESSVFIVKLGVTLLVMMPLRAFSPRPADAAEVKILKQKPRSATHRNQRRAIK